MTDPRILTIDIERFPLIVYRWGLFDKGPVALNQILSVSETACWAAKWLGEDRVMFRSSFHDGKDKMIAEAWKLLDEADIVVSYNGAKFDIPKLNRDFVVEKLGPPSPFMQVDLYRVGKREFGFDSNKLDHVAQEMGIGAKVRHEGMDLWRACMAGDKRAWARMRSYNKGDVVLTEGLYEAWLPWIRNHPHLGLIMQHESACPNCGSESIQKRGITYVGISVYQRYRCNICGKWSRGSKALARVETRGIA